MKYLRRRELDGAKRSNDYLAIVSALSRGASVNFIAHVSRGNKGCEVYFKNEDLHVEFKFTGGGSVRIGSGSLDLMLDESDEFLFEPTTSCVSVSTHIDPRSVARFGSLFTASSVEEGSVAQRIGKSYVKADPSSLEISEISCDGVDYSDALLSVDFSFYEGLSTTHVLALCSLFKLKYL